MAKGEEENTKDGLTVSLGTHLVGLVSYHHASNISFLLLKIVKD